VKLIDELTIKNIDFLRCRPLLEVIRKYFEDKIPNGL
jgi:hypothetical protein